LKTFAAAAFQRVIIARKKWMNIAAERLGQQGGMKCANL
jgi:hypothetical protein